MAWHHLRIGPGGIKPALLIWVDGLADDPLVRSQIAWLEVQVHTEMRIRRFGLLHAEPEDPEKGE